MIKISNDHIIRKNVLLYGNKFLDIRTGVDEPNQTIMDKCIYFYQEYKNYIDSFK